MLDDDFTPPPNIALVAAIFEGGLAVVAVALGWLVGRAPLETFRFTWPDVGRGALATLPPLMLLWVCLKCPLRPFVELVRVVDRVLVPLFRECRVLELAVISLLAGLGEEMLFRGVIQQVVEDWVGEPSGRWVGLAVAAILFGLLHHVTRTYAVLAAVIGLYLGSIWLATGNLLVPIIVHAVYDFLVLVYLIKFRGRESGSRSAAALEQQPTHDGQENQQPPD